MKKILFIHSSLGGGGAERVLIDILKNIDTDSFQVDLLLIYGTGVYMKDIPANINYIGCLYEKKRPFGKWFVARLHLGHLFECREIRRVMKGRYYDTIVSFMENGPLKYHGFITDKAQNNVSWVHTDLLNNHYSRCSFLSDNHEKKIYQKMNTIVFVSDTALNNFQKLFNLRNVNMKVIHNPIDAVRIQNRSLEESVPKIKFTLCAVGRICPQKRYDRLLHAVKILYDKGCDITVNILGTGYMEAEIKKMCSSLNLDTIVNFLGFKENPYPYIKNSDVFCLSSDTEGYPTVVCEAIVLGVPVVATDIVGSRDIIGQNEYGLLTGLTPESFADAIYSLYNDESLLNYYKRKASEKAKEFGISRAIKEINTVI